MKFWPMDRGRGARRMHPPNGGLGAPVGILLTLALVGCDLSPGSSDRFADLPPAGVEPELEIGTVDGGVTFGHVLAAVEGPNGVLHVLEWNQAEIQRFGPDGEPLAPLGRAGSGPGEFTRPARLGWDEEGLWVLDPGANRLTWFGEGDEVIRTLAGRPVVISPGEASFRVGVPLGDGTLTADQVTSMSQIHGGGLTHAAILRVDEEMAPLDTLAIRRVAGQSVQVTDDPSQGGMFTTHPFPTAHIRQVLTGRPDSPAGMALVDWTWEPEPELQVTRKSLDGNTVFRTSLPFEPTPVTEPMIERYVERIAEAYGSARDITPQRARSVVRDALEAPLHLRPVDAVVEGPAGALWLRLAHPEGYDGRMDHTLPSTGDRWLVLEGDGEPDRVVELPPGWSLQWVGPEHIWAVRTDELEVNYLVRARLITGSE
jgi:hypothetical protein